MPQVGFAYSTGLSFLNEQITGNFGNGFNYGKERSVISRSDPTKLVVLTLSPNSPLMTDKHSEKMPENISFRWLLGVRKAALESKRESLLFFFLLIWAPVRSSHASFGLQILKCKGCGRVQNPCLVVSRPWSPGCFDHTAKLHRLPGNVLTSNAWVVVATQQSQLGTTHRTVVTGFESFESPDSCSPTNWCPLAVGQRSKGSMCSRGWIPPGGRQAASSSSISAIFQLESRTCLFWSVEQNERHIDWLNQNAVGTA